MEKLATINEVSQALGIPASTLRYWDKQGLLRFERNHENNYRQFSFQTMLDICDIMLLRDLEVPLNTLKKREEMTLEALSDLFANMKDNLAQTILHLQSVIEKITIREQTLAKLVQLKQQKPTIKKHQLAPIHSFDFTDAKLIKMYLEDPTRSADILYMDGKDHYVCGLFADIDSSQLLRAADQAEKLYLYGLTWRSQTQEPNIEALFKEAALTRADIKEIIFQYIFSAQEQGEYRDYFETWIALRS